MRREGELLTPNGFWRGLKAIDDCSLRDLGFIRNPFTWERNRGKEDWVQQRLDRVFVSDDWLDSFQQSQVLHIDTTSSDHLPILLQLRRYVITCRKKSFRFENCWLNDTEFANVVGRSWSSTCGLDIQTRLRLCRESLNRWGAENVSSLQKRIVSVKKRIRFLRGKYDRDSIIELESVEEEYYRLIKSEEDFWKQRAKVFWLKIRDINSKPFHIVANDRKAKQRIEKL